MSCVEQIASGDGQNGIFRPMFGVSGYIPETGRGGQSCRPGGSGAEIPQSDCDQRRLKEGKENVDFADYINVPAVSDRNVLLHDHAENLR